MFERFTERARKALALANQEAQRFNHEYIGTEHILLSLVKEGSGVGVNVLKSLGVDLGRACIEVEKAVNSRLDIISMGKLPQTPRAKKVIEYSIEAARSLRHRYVGTEHLLLGLVREEEGIAGVVLRSLGLKLEDLRQEVVDIVGAGADQEESIVKSNIQPKVMANDKPIRVGIVGVSGYGGGEVLRICATHPAFAVTYVAGEGSAGQKLVERFPGISKLGDLTIQKWNPDELPELDLLFASLPTGQSKEAL